MRERIAIGISLVTIVLLVMLAGVFAATQNAAPPGTPISEATPAAVPTPGDPAEPASAGPAVDEARPQARDSAAGRSVYTTTGCARCHAVDGVGNRRYPLDGVGARRTRASLRAWTMGAEPARDSLSPSAVRTKQRYAELPEAQVDLLLDYLESLRRLP
jgi:cytochrome c553